MRIKYHPLNGNYSCANAVLILHSKLLGDDEPDISDAVKNIKIMKKLNTQLLNWRLVTTVHALQSLSFFWNAIANWFKSKIIQLIFTRLCSDLRDNFPDRVIDIRAFKDVHNCHNSADRGAEDKISWRSMCVPFDDKTLGWNLLKEWEPIMVLVMKINQIDFFRKVVQFL